MIKKVKATLFEKMMFIFLIILASVTLGSYFVIKNKCLFVKNYNPKKQKTQTQKALESHLVARGRLELPTSGL